MRAFIHEDQGEHERFGIFDPAARWTYMVGVVTVAGLMGASLVEWLGRGAGAWVAGAAVAASLLIAGAWAFRRIWVRPAEREVLLQMAREDDEARALAARMAREKRQQ